MRGSTAASRRALLACALLASGCGLVGGSVRAPAAPASASGGDARCQAAAANDRPLVTEWSASDKAYLESLAAGQAVAVRYSGCEMRVLGECKLPGRYVYRRTTLASDTLEIKDADDLYAKLPLGGVGLEGELARSGRLAVRTTVAGQFQLADAPAQLPPSPACLEATHLIVGISVGAFSLLTGGAQSAGGGVSASGVGVSGHTRREESVMRQAGDAARCGDGDDRAPSPQCGSPVQVFLRPMAPPRDDPGAAVAADERRAREQGVQMELPAPREPSEVWNLHNSAGQPLCRLPCTRWVPPRSGYYLERAALDGQPSLRIDVPHDFPYAPGTRLHGDYSPGRGSPFLSLLTLLLLGGPSAVGAVVVTIVHVTEDDDRDRWATPILLLSAIGGASIGWYVYSHDKRLQLRPAPSAAAGPPALRFSLTPFGLSGEF